MRSLPVVPRHHGKIQIQIHFWARTQRYLRPALDVEFSDRRINQEMRLT